MTSSPSDALPSLPAHAHPLEADKFIDIGVCESTNIPLTICYNTFGNPQDPCVLLVNGLGSSLLQWKDSFCNGIAEKGFYVIRFDNRDVGLSTHLSAFPPPCVVRFILPRCLSFGEGSPCYTLNDMAKDGMKLLSHLGIEKAHVVGGSMGGMIVQCMAILFPQRVLSLNIIYSHSGGPNVKPQTWGMTFSFLDGPKKNTLESILEFKVRHKKLFLGDYTMDEDIIREDARRNLARCDEDSAGSSRQIWAIQRAESREAALKKLRVPTVIIHGKQDTMIPYANGVALQKLILGSRLVTYEKMGHSIPSELYEDMTNSLCQNFALGSTKEEI